MRFWATQSREPAKHYEHKEVGYNYRMSNICAGIGRGQLENLNMRIESKKKIRDFYINSLKDFPIEFIPIPDNSDSNYWLTVMLLRSNATVKPFDIIGKLEEGNIESRPVWKPMSLQPLFNESGFFLTQKKSL